MDRSQPAIPAYPAPGLNLAGLGIAEILAHNPVLGERRSGHSREWTNKEVEKVKKLYPAGGMEACLAALPGRSAGAIYQKACRYKLTAPGGSRRATEAPSKGVPRKRWFSTPEIDRVIQAKMPSAKKRSDVAKLSVALMRPTWWVRKRAVQLGIMPMQLKDAPWSDAEMQLLREHEGLGPNAISLKLKKAGFKRTPLAVRVKTLRLSMSVAIQTGNYTARELGRLLGVDSHTVVKWITQNLLRAKQRGTGRAQAGNGEIWDIRPADVRAFLAAHGGHLVDVRRVDGPWFIDLLLGRLNKSP